MHPTLDVKDIPRFPNCWDTNSMINVPKFDSDPSLAIDHIAIFIKYASKVNMVHKDALMRLFINSPRTDQHE